jgi:parallel beta-helix repeat protein
MVHKKFDIFDLTTEASPDGAADFVKIYDDSASTEKKVLLNNLPGGGQNLYDAIVATSGGDFTSVEAAFTAGNSSVFVRDGTYVETASITIPDNGVLHGESPGGVVISFGGGDFSINADGNGGTKATAGTISVTTGSTTVTGSGTNWDPEISDGDYINLNGVFHKIATRDSDTQVTLESAYEGEALAAGTSYEAFTMLAGISIENIIVTGSVNHGIYFRAVHHGVIRDCLVSDCGDTVAANNQHNITLEDCSECVLTRVVSVNGKDGGLRVLNGAVISISGCSFKNNDDQGIQLEGCKNVNLDACMSLQNGLQGLHVIGTTTKVNITDSIFHGNNNDGIETNSSANEVVVSSCTLTDNGTHGIDFDGDANKIVNCLIQNNGENGIQGGDDGIIANNQIIGNGSHGIDLDSDSTTLVTGNRIVNNSLSGVHLDGTFDDNIVIGNIIEGNTNDGVFCESSMHVISNNQILNNGSQGIHLTSTSGDNVVSNNFITGNTSQGILDDGSANELINNHSSGNTGANYSFGAGSIDSKISNQKWIRNVVSHTDLQAAATVNDIELLSLPAAGIIHACKIKHSTIFAGTGITDYKVSVGISGNLTKYHTDFDVDTAVSNTNQSLQFNTGTENHGAATSIRVRATSTGANLNASTSGSVTIWVLISEAF